MLYDVIVVGGGPAGAYFSNIVSGFGYNVLIIEKDVIGRDKLCAGGVTPRCFDILNSSFGKIPKEIVERKIDNALFTSKNEYVEVDFPPLKAFTTDRGKFDKWLITKSIDKGTTVYENCKVVDIKTSERVAKIIYRNGGKLHEKNANMIVDCHGANKTKWTNLKHAVPEHVIAVQAEIEMSKEYIDNHIGNAIEFYFDASYSGFGYSWVFPKKESVTVGLLDRTPSKNLKERLNKFIHTHPIVSKKLCAKSLISNNNLILRGALIPNKIPERIFHDRYMLVGDAAGFSDRITWEGISYAIESAKYAANVCNYAHQVDDFSENVFGEYYKKCEPFMKELNFGNTVQKLVYGKNLDNVWDNLLKSLNENEHFKNLVLNELNLKNHTSIAKMIGDLPTSKKLRLMNKIGLKNLISCIIGV